MLAAVVLQVVGAVALKGLADHFDDWSAAWIVAGIAVVGVLNVLRLVVWGFAHRRFPLSTTFPLSTLFFPLMLIVAGLFGDPIYVQQIAGTLLITAGVFWINAKVV